MWEALLKVMDQQNNYISLQLLSALRRFKVSFSSLSDCLACSFTFFIHSSPLSLLHFQTQQVAVFSEKNPLKTFCTLPAEHQTADSKQQLACEYDIEPDKSFRK